MLISYDKLWKLLIDIEMNEVDLLEQTGLTYNIIARLRKEQPVDMETLYRICKCLDCNIGEIMEFKSEK